MTRSPMGSLLSRAQSMFAGALFLSTCALVGQQDVTVFRGARILPVAGDAIDNGVLIVVAGKIQLLAGASASVPEGAVVVDCAGKVITPGLVDAGTSTGLSTRDANEQGSEVTPQVHVLDAIDPQDQGFVRARRHGVTTLQVGAGNRNVIGGLGVVLKNRGVRLRDMVLREESGLRMSLGAEASFGNRGIRGGVPSSIYSRRPTTRMGVVWEARKAFYDALDYREEKSIANGDGPALHDAGFEVLLRAIDKELVVHSTARAEHDIRTALRLAEEFGYETLIEGATEAWRMPDELAAAGVRVLVSSPSTQSAGERADDAEARWHTLLELSRAGVPFAIQTGTDGSPLPLIHEAMFAVRNGLTPAQALAAITLVPAQILAVDERVGSLAVGKDADFVIWSDSPFSPTTRIEAVYVDGEEIES